MSEANNDATVKAPKTVKPLDPTLKAIADDMGKLTLSTRKKLLDIGRDCVKWGKGKNLSGSGKIIDAMVTEFQLRKMILDTVTVKKCFRAIADAKTADELGCFDKWKDCTSEREAQILLYGIPEKAPTVTPFQRMHNLVCLCVKKNDAQTLKKMKREIVRAMEAMGVKTKKAPDTFSHGAMAPVADAAK